jgi:hypothetical protein
MSLIKLLAEEFSSKSSKQITITPEAFEKLKEVFDHFGSDITKVFKIVDVIEENNSYIDQVRSGIVDKTGKKYIEIPEREEIILVANSDPAIWKPKDPEFLMTFIHEGAEYMNWYYDASKKVYSALGEEDGCAFLSLLALTSPNTGILANLYKASELFTALKTDLKDPKMTEVFRLLAKKFKGIPKGAVSVTLDLSTEDDSYEIYRNSELYKVVRGKYSDFNKLPSDHVFKGKGAQKAKNMGRNVNAEVMKFLVMYFSLNERLTPDRCVQYLYKIYNIESKSANKLLTVDSFGSFKVMNFAINLLKPDYKSDLFWQPVTIDTWMIQYFYPQINDIRNKTKDSFSKYVGTATKYHYVAKEIIDITNYLNKTGALNGWTDLSPHQIQAAIWSGTKKNIDSIVNKGKTDLDFDSVIQEKANYLAKYNAQLKSINIDGALNNAKTELDPTTIRDTLSAIGEYKKDKNTTVKF